MILAAICGFFIGLGCALPLGLWALRHRDANLDRAELICMAAMLLLAVAFGYHLDGPPGSVGGLLGVAPLLLLGLNDIRQGRQTARPH